MDRKELTAKTDKAPESQVSLEGEVPTEHGFGSSATRQFSKSIIREIGNSANGYKLPSPTSGDATINLSILGSVGACPNGRDEGRG